MHKLGKQPVRYDHRDLLFETYADLAAVLPALPAVWGHGLVFDEWGMLRNDEIGDCVPVGGAHETMLWNKVWANRIVRFSDRNTTKDYSAISGYVPGDESTDVGCDMRTALNYRRIKGLTDENGKKHHLHAYARLKLGDWDQLLMATYLFGVAAIGFNFPEIAWEQFDNGKPWDVTSHDGDLIGGHYVPCVGFGNPGPDKCAVVTWNVRQIMTRDFYEKYSDEGYALVSVEALNASGLGPHGFPLDRLDHDLAVLTS